MNNRTMKPLVWDEGTAEIKALWHGDRYVTIATVCVPAWHEDAVCGAREAGANAAYLVEAWNSYASQASRIAELEKALSDLLVQALQSELNTPAHEWGHEAIQSAIAALPNFGKPVLSTQAAE